eukprot:CAMPEP_0170496376 /NCGR_PEP_ID=MMETSP0208-20121228/21256_1 /TAXON_ID=197538 /ORGANISM="Strombidium inclinatum, Strain S3" /LENGTH=197 /DNA_ID=CAMNT_0010772897 /DNA_START=87 /DNA_END=680 /DNA_ORIENTATION=+
MQIEHISTTPFSALKQLHNSADQNKLISSLYSMAVDEAPKLVAEGRIRTSKEKLTMYSLYKQVEEGDYDDEVGSGMQREKAFAWKQQKGKFSIQCKKEYILLIARKSSTLRKTLDSVLAGTIQELNYKSKSNVATSTGGALAKSVPKPKDVHVEENKKFVAGLNKRELGLKDLYEEIRMNKDSERLITMVKEGEISP